MRTPYATVVAVMALTAAVLSSAQTHCTVAKDCHGHASSVTPVEGQCVCSCRTKWTGSQCQDCPEQYDISNDCYGCNTGYVGSFPNCVSDKCTLVDCNNHAITVSGFRTTGCTCDCANQ